VRVLLITDWLPGIGGAEVYISGLRDGLLAAGDEVRLLTSAVGSAGDGSADYRARGSERTAAKLMLQIVNPFAVAVLRSALRDFRPDVVLLNMFEHQLSPAILGQLRKVPTVQFVTDYKGVCPIATKLLPNGSICRHRAGLVCWRSGCVSFPHWLRDQPRYALIRTGRKRLDRVLACSEWMRRELMFNGVAAEYLTLPVPPPGPTFRRTPASDPLFVFCGRLDPIKGLVLLVRAFHRLRMMVPRAALRIVGEGPQRSSLEQLVNSLRLEAAVTLRGWIPPDQVEHELADAWAVVVPSLWAEPLGLVAVEAIVRGIPVIASGSGGLGEVVEHGSSGLLFSNGDELGLTQALQTIAEREAFSSHVLAEEVVTRVREAHSMTRHVQSLRRVFEEISRPVSEQTEVNRAASSAATTRSLR